MCCLCWSQERSQKQAWVLPANSPNISVVSTFPSAPSFRTHIDTGFKNEDPGKFGHPQHVMTAWLKRGVPSKMAADFDEEEIWSNHAAGSFAYSSTLAVFLFGFCVNFRNCKTQHANGLIETVLFPRGWQSVVSHRRLSRGGLLSCRWQFRGELSYLEALSIVVLPHVCLGVPLFMIHASIHYLLALVSLPL